jgi:hypothetical protein
VTRALRHLVLAVVLGAATASLHGQQATAPLIPVPVRFAVIGDMGTGKAAQYDVGALMEKARATVPFEFVITLGDNIYGGNSPKDYLNKFEKPYKAMLDAGVLFYASLGNHDSPTQRDYKPFNMGGRQYYTYRKGSVQFFALDSGYMSPAQIAWLVSELEASEADWKICYFHHPLYSSGAYHGSSVELRLILEPIFVTYGVQVVFAGHEHFYERLKPQRGVSYFVAGGAGQLRKGDLKPASALTAVGYDKDRSFMTVEIIGDTLRFEAVSRTGQRVDSGVIVRLPLLSDKKRRSE